MAESSGGARRSIGASSDETAGQVNRIAESATGGGGGSQGVTDALQRVNDVAQSTIGGMQSTSQVISRIIEQAARLDAIMSRLRQD